jgi:hypothetical protein
LLFALHSTPPTILFNLHLKLVKLLQFERIWLVYSSSMPDVLCPVSVHFPCFSVSRLHLFRAIPGRYEMPTERIQKSPSTVARVIAGGFVYELTTRIGPLHRDDGFREDEIQTIFPIRTKMQTIFSESNRTPLHFTYKSVQTFVYLAKLLRSQPEDVTSLSPLLTLLKTCLYNTHQFDRARIACDRLAGE